MKKLLKIILILILAVIVIVGGVTAFLTITEFKPDPMETLEIAGTPEKTEIHAGEEFTMLTYNIGYAGQSADMDLYDEGGELVHASSKSLIDKNMEAIRQIMKIENCDVLLLQQVDRKSSRSHSVDEVTYIESTFPGQASFAENFVCKFIPLPISQPMGSVDGGLLSINKYQLATAERKALVAGFTWPMKLFKPKNCLSVQRVQLGTAEVPEEAQLVIVNLLFDVDDDGEIKIEQTKELANFMKDEYAKGNYVIAGGTFYQTFPGSDSTLYPIRNTGFFLPGQIEETLFGEGWTFAYDESTPTARLMNQPHNEYDPYMQYYVIDGFISSPNITVTECYTIDTEFKYAAHQPVKVSVCLGKPAPKPQEQTVQYDENGNPVAAEPQKVPNTYISDVKIGEGVLQTTGELIYGTN